MLTTSPARRLLPARQRQRSASESARDDTQFWHADTSEKQKWDRLRWIEWWRSQGWSWNGHCWDHRGAAGHTHPAPAMNDARANRGRSVAIEDRARQRAYKDARRSANRKVWFFGHAVIFAGVCFFLLVVAGFFPALVVALSWGIGLSAHGFFWVVAPELRNRWVEGEVSSRVQSSVTTQRRALEGKHSRSIEELAASVAHEIRNPITAAKSLVQQIGEDPTSQENVEYSKIAVEELDRVEKAISHLLRYAREEEVRLSPTLVVDVVDSAMENLRERLERGRISVHRNVDSSVGFDADADKLRRVLINLVGNAIDAFADSDFPNPTIDIAAGMNLAGNEAWIRVRDNGAGIDSDELTKIFNPFHTSKESGTGLGLAITKKIVESHGGRIEVKSELGVGTEFVMTFPKYAGEAPRSG